MTDISSPEQTATRPKDLFSSSETVIEHFQPDESGKDRFGNRFFPSKEGLASGLLVSPAGEKFIKTNPHILTDLSQGLALATSDSFAGYPKKFVDIGPGRKIRYFDSGGQSAVFIMDVLGSQYLVKLKKAPAPGLGDATQPYINEILQMQSLAKDLAPNLEELGVRLPDYLFASPTVAVRKYEEGEEPKEEEIREKFIKLGTIVTNYIAEQKNLGNSLWDNIAVDMKSPLGDLQTKNFIRKTSGELVWIDPVYYQDKTLHELPI